MSGRPDIQRLIGDLVRLGTIGTVDHQRARCTVDIGDLSTGPIPWLTHRAGAASSWSPPSPGEQVVLLCPEGDIAAAVALRGIYSDANSAPASTAGLELLRFADGSIASYDAEAKHLAVALASGATATISAPGGITLVGDVTIAGKLDVRDDATARGVSLHDHQHGLVKSGTDRSGPPA